MIDGIAEAAPKHKSVVFIETERSVAIASTTSPTKTERVFIRIEVVVILVGDAGDAADKTSIRTSRISEMVAQKRYIFEGVVTQMVLEEVSIICEHEVKVVIILVVADVDAADVS